MSLITKLSKYYKIAYQLGHYPTLLSVLFTKKKVIAYYGFLGDKNFGDELVYDAAKSLFAPNILLPIRKFMPLSLLFFKRFFSAKIDGIIIGGGTLIRGKLKGHDYFLDLVEKGVPVFVFGTGVNDTIEDAEGWKKIFSLKTYGGVRGPLSKNNLEKVSIQLPVAGDAAFVFFRETASSVKETNTVLINFGTHLVYDEIESSRAEIKAFIVYLLERGFEVHYLPFHEIDVELGIKLNEEFPTIKLLDVPHTFDDCVEIFHSSTFAIGERLHFNVMALLGRCNFLSINYDKKHEDFLASVDLSHCGLAMSEVSFEKILSTFEQQSNTDRNLIDKTVLNLRDFQINAAKEFLNNMN